MYVDIFQADVNNHVFVSSPKISSNKKSDTEDIKKFKIFFFFTILVIFI